MTNIIYISKDTQQETLFISFNSGIMVQIYTQIVATFHDFCGVLLGNCKLTQHEKETTIIRNTSQSLSPTNKAKDIIITEMNIDSIIVVYELISPSTIQPLMKSISSDYPDKVIIGMFSAKSFSYPTISLKEQELHLVLSKYLRNELKGIYLSIPLLYALFIHSTKTTKSIKQLNQFESKIYLFDEVRQVFEAAKFKITNMKFDNYSDKINPIANKTPSFIINFNYTNKFNPNNIIVNGFEKEIEQLKIEIETTLKEINTTKMIQVKKYKKRLHRYLDHHIRLSKFVKSLSSD